MVALVLLPGMDGTGTLFADFCAALDQKIRPVIVSYPENQAFGYDELEACVRAVLPTHGPFVLLGESFSGPVAIALAASKPPGLVGLFLCCTFARNPVPRPQPLRSIVNMLPWTARFSDLGVPLMLGRFSTASLRKNLRQALARVPAATLRARLRAVLDVDVSESLKEIDVPILYLQASRDHVVSKSAAIVIQSLSPHARVVTLEGPHLLLQALPVAVGNIVEEFATEMTATYDPSLRTGAYRSLST